MKNGRCRIRQSTAACGWQTAYVLSPRRGWDAGVCARVNATPSGARNYPPLQLKTAQLSRNFATFVVRSSEAQQINLCPYFAMWVIKKKKKKKKKQI
jgi:hypothetical protein